MSHTDGDIRRYVEQATEDRFNEVLTEIRTLREAVIYLSEQIDALKPTTVEVAPNQFKVVRGPVREVKP